ncbi:MAG TPA: phosphate ABC transporter substrate-binding protein PstS, partial [Bacteroidia bacterium]|nr:phosphate ABC transporter substrate-binding protein PstS [Bacteroidia bacterium]
MKNTMFKQLAVAGAIASLGLVACNSASDNPADKQLVGAGSTFGNPIYTKMFSDYGASDAGKGIQTNYQSIGSGGGIKNIMGKTVDFGASDAFLSDDDIAKAPAGVVEFPTCLGAVVVSYNLPGNPEIKMTPDILAGIFLGTITKWNDEKIAAENPDAKLPEEAINVVHRSDGSGTSYIFTDYLSKVSA